MNTLFANSKCLEDEEFMRLVWETDPEYSLHLAVVENGKKADESVCCHVGEKDDVEGKRGGTGNRQRKELNSVENTDGKEKTGTSQTLKSTPASKSGDRGESPRQEDQRLREGDRYASARDRYAKDCEEWLTNVIRGCDYHEKPSNQRDDWPAQTRHAKQTRDWFDPEHRAYVPDLVQGEWTHLVPLNPVPLKALSADLHPIVKRVLSVFTLNRCASSGPGAASVKNVGFAFACARNRELLDRWAKLILRARYAPWSEKRVIVGLSRYKSAEEMKTHFEANGTLGNLNTFWFDKMNRGVEVFVRQNKAYWESGGGGSVGGHQGGKGGKGGWGPPYQGRSGGSNGNHRNQGENYSGQQRGPANRGENYYSSHQRSSAGPSNLHRAAAFLEPRGDPPHPLRGYRAGHGGTAPRGYGNDRNPQYYHYEDEVVDHRNYNYSHTRSRGREHDHGRHNFEQLSPNEGAHHGPLNGRWAHLRDEGGYNYNYNRNDRPDHRGGSNRNGAARPALLVLPTTIPQQIVVTCTTEGPPDEEEQGHRATRQLLIQQFRLIKMLRPPQLIQPNKKPWCAAASSFYGACRLGVQGRAKQADSSQRARVLENIRSEILMGKAGTAVQLLQDLMAEITGSGDRER
eukprot:g8910.t1